MPSTTPNLALPYPVAADTADVPRDIQALAVKLDGYTSLRPPVVTSLPGSPVDGQEVYYVADAANGVVWHLRYRSAAAGAYKWECIGGTPLFGKVDTQQAVAAGAMTDPATPGPDVTVPLAGDYHGDMYFWAIATVSGVQFDVQVFQAGVGGNLYARQVQASANAYTTAAALDRLTGLAAATLLRMRYSTNGNGTQFSNRRLRVMPVRVG
jgi:hypothetical protein